jgi:CBS domain-containing protein
MLVEDIMTLNPWTCAPSDTLADAARIMWERDCGCVPVVDGDRLVGIITDRDICMATFLNGRAPDELEVRSVMCDRVVTCSPHETVGDAESRMQSRQIRRIPVVDVGDDGGRGHLVGILSLNDVALAATETAPEELTGNEVADTLAAVGRHRTPRAFAG